MFLLSCCAGELDLGYMEKVTPCLQHGRDTGMPML